MATNQSALGQLELPEEEERKAKPGQVPVRQVPDPTPQPTQNGLDMYAPTDASQGDLEIPPPEQPGFGTRLAQSWGVPTDAEGWKHLGVETAKNMVSGGMYAPIKSSMDYLTNAYKGAREGHKEIMEAQQNIQEGGPVGANLGKAGYGAVHGIYQAIPGVGPTAETMGEDIHDKNYAGAAGGAVGAMSQAVLPEVGERALNRYSTPGYSKRGGEHIKTALDTPAGKGGERAASMDRAIEDTKSDLAEIERNEPGKAKGAQAYHELAEKIEARQDKLWEDGHKPGIERHADAPVDHKAIVKAGDDAITPEAADAAPHEAEAARAWLKGLDKERGLKSADQLIREINSDLKGKSAATYGPVQIRVRQVVVKALRNEVDRVLDQSGEKGVKEVNRRWGALDEVNTQMRSKAYDLARKEGKEGMLPEWAHAYAFLHPAALAGIHGAPVAVGMGLKLSKLAGPKTGGKALRAGMRDLGRTNLEAPTSAPTPAGWGAPPRGLLPAPTPPIQGLPGPGAAEIAHPEMFPHPPVSAEPVTNVQRGEAGHMQRVYTGVGKPPIEGATAEGGPIRRDLPPAPEPQGTPVPVGPTPEFTERFAKPAKSRVDAQREEAADKGNKERGFRVKSKEERRHDMANDIERGFNEPGFKTETDSMGIKWAISEDGKYRVSVPKRITPEELPGYVKEKLDEQRTIHGKIKHK